LHPQKDPLLLVRSIAALDDPTVHLLMAGEGEMADLLQQEIETLGLTQRITLLGATPRAEMAKLYRLAQVLVLTSVYEGLPVTVLEALASGTPIATTDCGDTPRLLTADSGLVCPDRSPKTIASTLRHLLDHPEKFPVAACVQAAVPYGAKAAIRPIYDQMLQRWEKRIHAAIAG
jgi:glycosyltransferase involved in cell wall biosynthesis